MVELTTKFISFLACNSITSPSTKCNKYKSKRKIRVRTQKRNKKAAATSRADKDMAEFEWDQGQEAVAWGAQEHRAADGAIQDHRAWNQTEAVLERRAGQLV